MNPWFDDFARRCEEVAARRHVAVDAPSLDGDLARTVLELTKVVAHTSERQYAPLAAFLAGRTVERMARSGANLTEKEVAGFIAELTASLEADGSP